MEETNGEELTEREMEVVMTVFRTFETGTREATIHPKVCLPQANVNNFIVTQIQDLHITMKMLGLNPEEQEVVDLTNTITRNGVIFFPDFCKIVLKKWREEDEEVFRQNMFKVCQTALDYPFESNSSLHTLLMPNKILILAFPLTFSCCVAQNHSLSCTGPRNTN